MAEFKQRDHILADDSDDSIGPSVSFRGVKTQDKPPEKENRLKITPFRHQTNVQQFPNISSTKVDLVQEERIFGHRKRQNSLKLVSNAMAPPVG